jgi:hypothetical protein
MAAAHFGRVRAVPEERMLDVLYRLPTWLVGVLIVGVSTILPAVGLLVVHRRVPAEARRTQNDVASALSNVAAFVYAVMLAFLAVGVWETYGKAGATVQLEANSASDVFRQAEGYPEPFRRRVQDGIRRYVDLVVGEEWKLQARGRMSDTAWRTIEALHRDMLDFEPRGPREHIVHTEQLRDMNSLLDQRRLRVQMGATGLHPVVWAVILIGSVLIVSYSFFFGTASFRAHLAMTMILGASIGLVLFLIVAMDYPFRGGVGIGPDAFERIRENISRVDGK